MKVASPTAGRFGSVKARTRQVPVGADATSGTSSAAAADALVGDDRAPVLDAVRTLDHERERHADRGHALRVAQQRGDVHGLAGAVDAALGIDEGVEARTARCGRRRRGRSGRRPATCRLRNA